MGMVGWVGRSIGLWGEKGVDKRVIVECGGQFASPPKAAGVLKSP